MKGVVFGGAGQLGHELLVRAPETFTVVSFDLPDGDITNEQGVHAILERERPDFVINAAAYTAVDKAEEEQETAFYVNGNGAGIVAGVTRKLGVALLHVSTDYVFGEGFTEPITEDSPTKPLNVYGASKLRGEELVAEAHPEAIIVRTSSVHGVGGENFVHTMLRLFAEEKPVKVVNDQHMTATWAGWLADTIYQLTLLTGKRSGVVHAACAGVVSWYEFAKAISEEAAAFEKPSAQATIRPVAASEFQRPATRASYSALDCARLQEWCPGWRPISWRDGLRSHLEDYFTKEDDVEQT